MKWNIFAVSRWNEIKLHVIASLNVQLIDWILFIEKSTENGRHSGIGKIHIHVDQPRVFYSKIIRSITSDFSTIGSIAANGEIEKVRKQSTVYTYSVHNI